MRKGLFIFLFLFGLAFGEKILTSHAQGSYLLNCTGSGTNDTAALNTVLSAIGTTNPATIKLPNKATRCTFNTATMPSNVTLDDSDGSGLSVNSGQTLTIGNFRGPRKQSFYGSGTVLFSGGADNVFPEWWGVKADVYTANDGVVTSGSTTFSSASHPATSTDISKSVIVEKVGTITAKNISGVTNANPAVITTSSSHGFTTGQTVVLSGFSSTLGTALNGLRVVTVLTSTTFSVPVDTTSTSSYGGSGATAQAAVALRTTVSNVSGGNYTLAASANATLSSAYFAVGTNNTTAFQKMLDSLPSVSRVNIAPGKYMLGSVTVPSGCYLYAAKDTVTIFSTANSVFVTSNKNSVTIDGIGIDAGGNPIGNGGYTAVGGTTMTNFRVVNSSFVDTFLTGNFAPVSTFNRHGVLARDYTNFKVLYSRFDNGLRIKGAGSSNQYNAEIAHNTFDNVNENGVSFLDATQAGETWQVSIHDNKFKNVMATGNCIVLGDDGGINGTVTSATNANPVVFTTSSAHGLTSGQAAYLSGGTGNWAAVNGASTVTVLTSTTFSIPVNSITFGAVTGTILVGAAQKNYNIDISNNEFRGSLPAGASFIQNRGAYIQQNINISHNKFINEGANASNVLAINSAQQTNGGTSIVNFTAIGNSAYGLYGGAATYRMSGINGGVIALNQAESTNSGVGLRGGTLTDVIISRNRLEGFVTGIYVVDGTLSGTVIENNMLKMANANSAVGIYIDTQTSVISSLTLKDNNIQGSGVANTNNYGIQDANNNNGNSDVVKYLRNDITNIDTTSGLGSSNYRTLPTHALVVNADSASATTLTVGSATPTVLGARVVHASNTGSTTITNLLNGCVNQLVTIVFTNGNTTVQSNSNIKLQTVGGFTTDFVGATDDSLTLVYQSGGYWQEVSRKHQGGQVGVLTGSWTTGLGAGTTNYLTNGFSSTDTSEVKRQVKLPATTISYLAVTIGGNQPASGSLVITLRKNSADTALTVTVPANSSGGFSVVDSTHSVTGAAGDTWDFKIVNNASGASANDVTVSAVMN